MKLIKFFFVILILIETTCSLKILKEENGSADRAELEEAAIKILTTCNATVSKMIALAGDFSTNFIERLSSIRSFALVILDKRRRSANSINLYKDIDGRRRLKTDILVTSVSDMTIFYDALLNSHFSLYDNPMALTLVLAWSPIKKYEACDGKLRTAEYFYHSNEKNHLRTILICHERTKGLLLYTSNPFINSAPEPWQQVPLSQTVWGKKHFYFVRKYEENDAICKNLDFEKTRDLGGSPIDVVYLYSGRILEWEKLNGPITSEVKRVRIEQKRAYTWIDYFLKHVNATKKVVWREIILGKLTYSGMYDIDAVPFRVRGLTREPRQYSTYPHSLDGSFLITQFRGNKSQLKKILTVIDGYSWIGMGLVYLITSIFFKFFLGLSVISGILNLLRLTCNFGLVSTPTSVSSRIYMGCLLFFVVTMLGIFTGNLAALLTHDFPESQANTIQDLIDLNYETVYADQLDLIVFDDPFFQGKVKKLLKDEPCIPYIEREPESACLTWGAKKKEKALQRKLHVSIGYVRMEQLCHSLPFRWALQRKLDKFIMDLIAGDIMVPLESLAEEKVFREIESQEIELEPQVMTLDHLGFAFAILGIGLSFASMAFAVELMIFRYQRRVWTTRVIVL